MAASSSSEAEDYSDDDNDDEEEVTVEPSAKKQRLGAAGSALEVAPPVSSKNNSRNKNKPKIIVLLDQATLETVKNRRGVYELLNCDDHRELCRKKLNKDPNDFRPDILHQELLALMDSPLNKAGLLQVYIHTQKKVLIEVNPSCRVPRTYKRFAGLMVQLLHKLKIKAAGESTTLLKVIKNPFSQHLAAGTHCYGFSSQGTLYSPVALAKTLLPPTLDDTRVPICLVLGAMATGHVTIQDHPYIEQMLSISEYPLSGAAALSRIMGGIEHLWGIV
jgi:rRNA small subunit pseudouridine methyltransferase Nep1